MRALPPRVTIYNDIIIILSTHIINAYIFSHDRGIRNMNDPDWLEVIGHPTIPHVLSLRAPPAQVALHANKDNFIGLANKTASRRYLQKLQKDRERNQEVLAECVDNLPMVIRLVNFVTFKSSLA